MAMISHLGHKDGEAVYHPALNGSNYLYGKWQCLGALLENAKSTMEFDIVCIVRLWKINSISIGSSGLQLPRSFLGDIERRQKPVYCRCCGSTVIGVRRLES